MKAITFSATLIDEDGIETDVEVEAHILPKIGATLIDPEEPEEVEIVSVMGESEMVNILTLREIAKLEEEALAQAELITCGNEDDPREDR